MDNSTLDWDFPVLNTTNAHASLNTTHGSRTFAVSELIPTLKILPMVLITAMAVVSNLLALAILCWNTSRNSRSTAFYHLVKILTVIDFGGVLLKEPISMTSKGRLLHWGGMPLCQYMAYTLVLVYGCTVSVVFIMSVERFVITKYPFQYGFIVTHRNLNISVFTLAMTWAIFAALPSMGVIQVTEKYPGTWCFFKRSHNFKGYAYITVFAGIGLFFLSVMAVLNSYVIHHLWRMRKARLTQSSGSRVRSGVDLKLGSESRMILFVLAIGVTFTICDSPLMLRLLVNQYRDHSLEREKGGRHDILDFMAQQMSSLNAVINPWIYIITRVSCCRTRYDDSSFSRGSTSVRRCRSRSVTFGYDSSSGLTHQKYSLGSTETSVRVSKAPPTNIDDVEEEAQAGKVARKASGQESPPSSGVDEKDVPSPFVQ